MKSYRKGAASFYIVAVSTLILVVLAVSFATAVIAEIGRTSNADLSQSAYDAALAGVEDAKVAFINYKNCKVGGATASDSAPSGGGEVTCADIIYWAEHPDCDMVAHILGRIGKDEKREVMISETTNGNNQMDQAYTCVEFDANLKDYKANIGSSNSYKVVKIDASQDDTDKIRVAKISWYKRDASSQEKLSFNSWEQMSGSSKIGVVFKSSKSINAAVPPILSVSYIQTAGTFKMEDFTETGNGGRGRTADRGTVFLVPTDNEDDAKPGAGNGSYIGVYDVLAVNNNSARANLVRNNQMVTNDTNKPYAVYCNPNSTSEYLCEAYLEIPDPYNVRGGHKRNNQTFMFVVGVPYGQPDTAFSLELYGESLDSSIEDAQYIALNGGSAFNMGYSQVSIDSTGRANDLYRRVEARVEPTDPSFSYLYYGIQLLGNDGNGFGKNMTVTCEPSAGTCSDQ